ncbi:MAG: trypsin-like peptidase domain-containing protein [Clostridia bacterium]|nr:trypsin-like peptidase domain-containing protein [Clostridia bacterium]
MKKGLAFKRIFAGVALSSAVGLSALFGGCASSGREGINGKDLNIYDIYEAAKAESGNPDMTMDEFLKQYLSYSPADLEHITSLEACINKSLMASVSVISRIKKGTTNRYHVSSSAGSGIIIDIDRENGDMLVLTNCHVVYSPDDDVLGDGYSDDISVWLYGSECSNYKVNNKNAIKAQLIAASITYDAALLKVTGSQKVKVSKAEKMNWCMREENYVGETVYAIGNANSETMSATVGYITKDLEKITVNAGTEEKPDYRSHPAVRTSAPINPGNSGGGLFNGDGELVGLVSASSKTYADRGYAITAASTRRVVNKMLNSYSGENTRGISIVDHGIEFTVTDSYSPGLNEHGDAEICEEITVSGVGMLSSAVGKLGIGDVIKHIKVIRRNTVVDEVEVNRMHNIDDIMLSVMPNDCVEFTVKGNYGNYHVSVYFTVNEFKTAD